MSRPLRIEYPDAWYHVMNRGRRSETIFSDEDDCHLFIDLLIETSEMLNVKVAAFCLMTNHYHVVLQTPEGNLSRCMQHLNGNYTQKFNVRHGYDGPMFRGRYKSILVSDDSYLLQLIRYVHKNPVHAGMVDHPQDYQQSSYKGYLSYAKKWNWLHKDHIFQLITAKKRGRLKDFARFMQEDDAPEIMSLFSKKRWPAIFGSENFVTQIKEKYYFQKYSYEVPESKKMVPAADTIINAVCEFYGVTLDDLVATRRGVFNKPRNIAIFLLRQLRGDELNCIKTKMQINTYSTVSSIIHKISALIKNDRKINKEVQLLKAKLIKGQM